MLCYGVVFNPIKCIKCETLVCRNCVNEKKLKPGKFMCFKKCGSKRFTEKMSLSEKLILNSLLFNCQNDECDAKIPYGQYFKHMRKECKVLRYKNITMPEGCA